MASKTYDQFAKDLEASRSAVLSVAGYLQGIGRLVTLPQHYLTPTEGERFDYQDSCDLFVGTPHQVKHSSRDFCSVEDFGFQMVTVDEWYKIERQLSPPAGYWIVNASLTGGIFVPWKTKKHWDHFLSKDATQGGRECDFARCHAEHCRYYGFQ
tara:strand:+ start:4130 stop:4591 length:462 start_codon:yes stop_codon:yes gene_type:complete